MTDEEKRVTDAPGAGMAQDPSEKKPKTGGFATLHFKENTVIFEEGDEGDAAYLIVKGRVEIRKGMKTSNPQTLAELTTGDVFGEMALFDERPRMAEAVARTPLDVITIRREEFDRRLETVDPVMRSITRYLVKRVRGMADEFIKRKDPSLSEWKKD